MSGDKYLISDKAGSYFVTFTIIHWIDIFSRKEYRDIIVASLNYCISEKGLIVYAWVIMSNHIHLVITTESDEGNISDIIRDSTPGSYEIEKKEEPQPFSKSGYGGMHTSG